MLTYTLLSVNILKDEVGGLQPTYSFFSDKHTFKIAGMSAE